MHVEGTLESNAVRPCCNMGGCGCKIAVQLSLGERRTVYILTSYSSKHEIIHSAGFMCAIHISAAIFENAASRLPGPDCCTYCESFPRIGCAVVGCIPRDATRKIYQVGSSCFGISSEMETGLLEEHCLHSKHAVASVGDVPASNGRLVCHRASAGNGMSGAAATSLQQPHLLYGIQLSSAGEKSIP